MRPSFQSEPHAGSGVEVPFASERSAESPTTSFHPEIPHRDYILLPLVSLFTMVLMFAAAEITTRIVWPVSEHGYCMNFNPMVGPHGRPDCTSIVKIAEAPTAVVHRFNHCGYRSDAACGPKTPGTYRIAVLGSSIAEGYMIPYEQMLASQMTETLQREWRRTVEFQNLAAESCPPIYSYRHLNEALRLRPDAIVLVLNPWDLEQDVKPELMSMRDDPKPINRVPAPLISLSPIQQLQAWTHESRTMLVAQHYMLQNRDTFIRLYLMAGGDHGAFVRYPFPEAWLRRFATTDVLLGEMARKIHAAGATFVVVAVPERAQVLMLREHNLPSGIDPYAFTRTISHIAAKDGIVFVDGLKALAGAPDPENLFYVVDGHATPSAHRILGQSIARALIDSTGR